jgi:hypothetical protein
MANRKPLVLVGGEIQQLQSGDVPIDGAGQPIVPDGGTTGQVLTKVDATNRNTTWADSGGGSALYTILKVVSLRV